MHQQTDSFLDQWATTLPHCEKQVLGYLCLLFLFSINMYCTLTICTLSLFVPLSLSLSHLLSLSKKLTHDLPEASPVFFHCSVRVMNRKKEVWRASNGSLLSDTTSIISVPPMLAPPPAAVPYPTLPSFSHLTLSGPYQLEIWREASSYIRLPVTSDIRTG